MIQFKEGLISREEALLRINAKAMDFFLHPYVPRRKDATHRAVY